MSDFDLPDYLRKLADTIEKRGLAEEPTTFIKRNNPIVGVGENGLVQRKAGTQHTLLVIWEYKGQ